MVNGLPQLLSRGFLFVLIFCALNVYGVVPKFESVEEFGGGGTNEYATVLLHDKQGNLILGGVFAADSNVVRNVVFTNTYPRADYSADCFLVKFDSQSNVLWKTSIAGTGHDLLLAGALDDLGNTFFFSEHYSLEISIGDFHAARTNSSRFAVTKLDTNGVVAWSHFLDGDDVLNGEAITVDTQGNCIVASVLSVVKFGSDGNLLWSRFVGGGGTIRLSTDTDGNIYALSSPVLKKIDPDGNTLWSVSRPGWAIQIDGVGSCYVAGVTSNGPQLTKYDSLGNLQWTNVLSGLGQSWAITMALNCETNVFVAGDLSDQCFIAKFDLGGTLLWLKTFQALYLQEFFLTAIAADFKGNIYMTGAIGMPLAFDDFTVGTAGYLDGFLARIPADPPRLYSQRTGNQLLLSWFTNQPNFMLEWTSDFGSTNWVSVSPTPTVSGNHHVMTNDFSGTNRFFRLRK